MFDCSLQQTDSTFLCSIQLTVCTFVDCHFYCTAHVYVDICFYDSVWAPFEWKGILYDSCLFIMYLYLSQIQLLRCQDWDLINSLLFYHSAFWCPPNHGFTSSNVTQREIIINCIEISGIVDYRFLNFLFLAKFMNRLRSFNKLFVNWLVAFLSLIAFPLFCFRLDNVVCVSPFVHYVCD